VQFYKVKRPDGILTAGLGVLIIAAAFVGVIMLAVLAQSYDPKTICLAALGFAGACALGAGFVNTWRTPMLTIRPGALIIPTFFGQREILIDTDHPLGEYLASSVHSNRRSGTIEGNKFIHFYTLDAGVLVELLSMHREATEISNIRRAFQDVAGLSIEVLDVDAAKPSRPDIAHWENR
jgi:hypothetical protein